MNEQRTYDDALSSMRHRVANDFNLLHALLGLAKRRVRPAECAILDAMQARARTIAIVHSIALPDGHGGASVDATTLLRRVVDALRGPASSGVQIELSCDRAELEFERAVAVALVIRELVDNALRHGFPSRDAQSKVYVELRRTARSVVLALGDNGVGFEPHQSGDGLGLTIVRLLAEQLQAQLTQESSPGTGSSVMLRFSADTAEEAWPAF